MKQVKRKTLAALTALCVLCTMSVPAFGAENTKTNDVSKLSNPRMTEAKPAVWDCVWFGNYPQKEIEPYSSKELYETLTNATDWNANNDIKVTEDKYHRVEEKSYTFEEDGTPIEHKRWRYYQYAPVKWRVLSVDGNEAFLLADKALDRKDYREGSDSEAPLIWETSTVRSWLNGYDGSKNLCGNDYVNDNFLDTAFSGKEQQAIYEKTVVNADNPYYHTDGGNDTKDKVFCLSIEEVTNPAYGFPSNHEDKSKTRRTLQTDYGKGPATGLATWWLRSPSMIAEMAEYVHPYGSLGHGQFDGLDENVRPALRLNLESSCWSYAGTVSSEGDVDEKTPGESSGFIKNPTSPEGVDSAVWDCVWFGNYPQSSDGKGGFKVEPIKWRVLSVEGEEALLLADKRLDAIKYNEEYVDITWETCTARSWLNGYDSGVNQYGKDYTDDNFIDKAFTGEERKSILEKTIQPSEYSYETVNDKVFFLSKTQAMNSDYGFSRDERVNTKTRRAVPTAYATSKSKYGIWWLSDASFHGTMGVGYDGTIDTDSNSEVFEMNKYGCSARPALWLNLNSDAWSYAGTISSDDPLEYPEDIVSLDHITATKTKTTYKTNEALATNDLTVTAFYSDGSNKAVTDYATNAAAIDMKTAGNKTLEVTYEENGITKKATIQITVTKADVPPASEPTQQTQGDKKEPKPTKPADKPQKPKTVTLKKVSSTKKGALKLTWKRDAKATGYQAVVATDKKFKKNKKTTTIKKNKTVTKTFTKLKRKKTYYAKVRAYKQVGKTKVYGSYSKVKKAKVK